MQRLYHHQTVVYARPVHQLYCVRDPPTPVRCRAIFPRRIDICTSVVIATVETLHATSLPPPNRRICTAGASIVLHARPTKHRAASCHLPPPDFYLYIGWYRNRRDVACNVSTTKPSYMHGRCINCIACAIRQTPCGVVPFTTAGFLFVRLLASHP
jgi:hypothetical protein